MVNKAKSMAIENELEGNKQNSRLLWKALKKLSPSGKVKSVPNDLKASRDQANLFNKHFVSTASTIVNNNQPATPDLSHIESFVNDRKPSTANFEIPLLDVNSLDELAKSLPSNVATSLDGMSAPLLKLISPAILEILTKVVNCRVQSGSCPSALKLAQVTPVHKSEPASDRNNFRLISVLPIISKLLERHIYCFNTICPRFRPHHSTESILIKMTDDWLEAMDQGLYTGAIFLDLRKAFDVVNHDLLVAKLQMHGCSS